MISKNVLVTGGAGFIGSHLVGHLISNGCNVVVFDNLSSGDINNLQIWRDSQQFEFVKGDLKNKGHIEGVLNEGIDLVFHFAANPEVRVGETDPLVHFNENLLATFNLLEAMRRSKNAKTIVFASTSTVYGEASILPTPEDYGPLVPISTYGASKLGCEALITSYAYTFDFRGLILRLANIVGPRSKHGVIFDFIRKLEADPNRLEILGDGKQKKSYLHVEDCVDAIIYVTKRFLENDKKVDIYNIGSVDQIEVHEIAHIVIKAMNLENVKYVFTGGVNGGRGWRGDVKNMHLSINKLLETGWKPKYNTKQAIQLTLKQIFNKKSRAW
ncbi:MAG: NAD-dependent epimerase/dehydratase family protein [Ignavibacterium sp.]|nr:NAD-dependent epimerase/dehydratase family protein [Ignavibacterium sp.]